jgi:hypothetical protein
MLDAALGSLQKVVRFREVYGQDVTPDGSGLWVRANDTPPPGYFWKVLFASVTGTLMNSPLNDKAPVSGFFVMDWNSPRELITDQNTATGNFPGVPLAKRGYAALDFDCSCPESAAFPGGGSAVQIPNFFLTANTKQSPACTVPAGKTVVFIGLSNPGAVEPGPGQGSMGNLTLYVLECPTIIPISNWGD